MAVALGILAFVMALGFTLVLTLLWRFVQGCGLVERKPWEGE